MKGWITAPEQYHGLQGYRIKRAETNYEHNKAAFTIGKGKMLHGQGTKVLKTLIYGTHSLEWCGCELIAVANTLTLTGHDMLLPEVIYEFELNMMHFIFPSGYFGTAPRKMKRFYDFHAIPYHSFNNALLLEEYLKDKEKVCGILSFWNRERETCKFFPLQFFTKGLHTVAFEKKYGKIYVYNRSNSVTAARQYLSVGEVFAGRRFITAYVLDEKTNALELYLIRLTIWRMQLTQP